MKMIPSRLSTAIRMFRWNLLIKGFVMCSCLFVLIFLLHRDIYERRKVFDPTYIDPDEFDFDINQNPCANDTYLLVYIHSHPKNSERRRVLRKTWASRETLARFRIKLLFVTGKVADPDIQTFLQTESELYQDILQGTFVDTYRNLTLKAITALKWVTSYCQDAVFVLKTDDDVIMAPGRFFRLLRSQIIPSYGNQDILGGYIWNKTKVVRDKSSKWYTSYQEYPYEEYLNYCSGSAFFMSYDVVERFYTSSRDVPFFWIDDYFVTGMVAHASNVTHITLNNRYIIENENNTRLKLKNDTMGQTIFIHLPDTGPPMQIWRTFSGR